MYTVYTGLDSRPTRSRFKAMLRRRVLAWLGLTCSIWDHGAGRWIVLRGAEQPAEGPYSPGGYTDLPPAPRPAPDEAERR